MAGLGLDEPPHSPWEWSSHPQKVKKEEKKIKNKNWRFVFLGWPILTIGGGQNHPRRLLGVWGWQMIFSFFFFGLFGVAKPPQRLHGWLVHPRLKGEIQNCLTASANRTNRYNRS
jgi:hypothetical protein